MTWFNLDPETARANARAVVERWEAQRARRDMATAPEGGSGVSVSPEDVPDVTEADTGADNTTSEAGAC